MPGIDGMCHNIHRWERDGGVSERYKLHYCRALGIHPGQFGPGAGGTGTPGHRTGAASATSRSCPRSPEPPAGSPAAP